MGLSTCILQLPSEITGQYHGQCRVNWGNSTSFFEPDMQQLVFYILLQTLSIQQLIYMESSLRSIAQVSYYCPLLSRCFIKKEETGKTETGVILLWRFYRKYIEKSGAFRGRDCLEKPFG